MTDQHQHQDRERGREEGRTLASTAPAVTAADGRSRGDRRLLRAAARWSAALLVFAGVGTGTAYGIAAMDRGDVPGLATESDGRWDYPRLVLPPLPADRPRPFTRGNRHHIHHADLRRLLLPAPAGSEVEGGLAGGWVDESQYVSQYAPEHRPALRQALADYAVRHVAARGWRMPDGTTCRIYLLRFSTADLATEFSQEEIGAGLSPDAALTAAPETWLDESWQWDDVVPHITLHVYDERGSRGPEHTRQAYILAGDTVALVVQSRKGSAAAVPFRQTVLLQAQLLG
ncbi:hypothetical protein [Streptomyces sp. DH12]|uniref:hypothetical protein n=1 Tax=Streptomyces sp. DH12 TaxID=2857010 RepID=UPI001E38781F|nr:hypothetical protein [Streptomyces sp. DH12]